LIIGGQYKILAELGAGGMGIVYQAVDTSLEREVALKKLRSEFSRSVDIAERFRREAKIQARLNHSHLAHLYSFFKEGDSFYIAMEFVNGTPLSQLLPMPWQRALPIFVQALEGLEYAHSLGVLHRDVKPDNIIVGSRGEVKVMDFGIAHVLGSARQTREKSIVGTLEYVCPEQIAGKELGPRSDIYSLGVLLFELISGRLPFVSETEFELLHDHLETLPPKLSSMIEVPPFLDEAIERAMAKSPTDRFASCREMEVFFRQKAPEVFVMPLEPLPGRFRQEEVDRSARRIEALIGGGEIELATLVVERAIEEYPGQASLEGYRTRLEEIRQQRSSSNTEDDKTAYLRDVLTRLCDLEQSGRTEGALELAEAAIAEHPQVPVLRIALASLEPPDSVTPSRRPSMDKEG
jgi:serine/threonine protein kinase